MSSSEQDQMQGQYSTSYSYSSYSRVNDEPPVINAERRAEEGTIDEHGHLKANKSLHEKYNPASHRLEPSSEEQKALEDKRMENH